MKSEVAAPAATLQLRFEVLDLHLVPEEAESINRSPQTVDIPALATAATGRGDTRVKYSLGGPVALGEKASFSVGQRVPFVRDSRVTKDGKVSPSISYEEVGCTLDLFPHRFQESDEGGFMVEFRVRVSELVLKSSVETAPDLAAPVFRKLSQEFTAHIRTGKDTYFWSLASGEQVRDRAGGMLVYVYRVRFDPQTED